MKEYYLLCLHLYCYGVTRIMLIPNILVEIHSTYMHIVNISLILWIIQMMAMQRKEISLSVALPSFE